jgi:chemosensory pili system protein ChpE
VGELLAYAFGLGLVFNATPGAVFAETLRRGVRGGFGPALAVQIGSLVGDAAWAVLGLAGVGALFQLPETRLPIAVIGSAILLWLGWRAIMDARRARLPEVEPGTVAPSRRGALVVGAAMSLGNPWNVVYWSGAAGAVAAVLGAAPSVGHMGVFFAGFMASSLIWCFIAAGAVAVLRRLLSTSLIRALELACGLALIGFGVAMLLRSFELI